MRHKLTRICIHLTLSLLVTTGFAQKAQQPNILFIMSDDHCERAIGVYDSRLATLNPSPNLDKLEGPYKLGDAPCTDNIDYIEDATVFEWNNKICLLTNDNFGTHTGVGGRGILWQSDTIPQLVRVNNYIQNIVEKIIEVPMIIEELREVEKIVEKIVKVENNIKEIIEVDRIQ